LADVWVVFTMLVTCFFPNCLYPFRNMIQFHESIFPNRKTPSTNYLQVVDQQWIQFLVSHRTVTSDKSCPKNIRKSLHSGGLDSSRQFFLRNSSLTLLHPPDVLTYNPLEQSFLWNQQLISMAAIRWDFTGTLWWVHSWRSIDPFQVDPGGI